MIRQLKVFRAGAEGGVRGREIKKEAREREREEAKIVLCSANWKDCILIIIHHHTVCVCVCVCVVWCGVVWCCVVLCVCVCVCVCACLCMPVHACACLCVCACVYLFCFCRVALSLLLLHPYCLDNLDFETFLSELQIPTPIIKLTDMVTKCWRVWYTEKGSLESLQQVEILTILKHYYNQLSSWELRESAWVNIPHKLYQKQTNFLPSPSSRYAVGAIDFLFLISET